MDMLLNIYDLSTFFANKDLYLYGAGGGGLALLQTIQDCHEHFQIKAFLDTYKQGSLAGRPVILLDKYRHNPEQNIIVIASHCWKEISALLKERDIHEFMLAPPFWVSDYMFTPKDRQTKHQEIKEIQTMLAASEDKKIFQYLLNARTHGSSLGELSLDKDSDTITLQFTDADYLKKNFPEHTDIQYLDFVIPHKIKIAVQAGVFDGKDIINLAKYAMHLEKAYGFEPSGDRYFLAELKKLAKQNIFVHENYALWHENTTLSFFPSRAGSFVSGSIAAAAMSVQAITLDEYCNSNQINKIDFICCDIEDAEINFLNGAKKTIIRDRPQMAVSMYHSKKQFFEIPLFLNELLDNYTYKLGHYGDDLNETTLYAIPNEIYKLEQQMGRA